MYWFWPDQRRAGKGGKSAREERSQSPHRVPRPAPGDPGAHGVGPRLRCPAPGRAEAVAHRRHLRRRPSDDRALPSSSGWGGQYTVGARTAPTVCGGPWDAYVLIFDKPELFFDLGWHANQPPEQAMAAFRAIVTHELWHLAFLEHQRRHWPRQHHKSSNQRVMFLYRMLNEGLGHDYSMHHRLHPSPTWPDFADRTQKVFALLTRNYSEYLCRSRCREPTEAPLAFPRGSAVLGQVGSCAGSPHAVRADPRAGTWSCEATARVGAFQRVPRL
jgi:hypothetical protein